MRGLLLGIAALACSLCAALPARAEAWVWTGWAPIANDQDGCLATGRAAVASTGFRTSGDQQTVFGWREEDHLSIRCIASHTVAVFFIYVRTSSEDGQMILGQLRASYGQVSGPVPGQK
jgi:hypothetical protein